MPPESTTTPEAAIRLRGVRQHNLKNFDIDLPLYRLIAVTGVSGSGKSSLALHTLYAEGQRRYVETFSPYARQFLERMNPPEADRIEGIPPAIAIESGTSVRSSRSTVGTITEVNDHLKVLYARLAVPHCPSCGEPVGEDRPENVLERLRDLPAGSRVLIAFPFTAPKESPEWIQGLVAQGFLRVFAGDGRVMDLEDLKTDPDGILGQEEILVVVDRLAWGSAPSERVVDSLETAFQMGSGRAAVVVLPEDIRFFSSSLGCARCQVAVPSPTPNLFSFNNPLGACPECRGFGRTIGVDLDLVVPDRRLTLRQGAVKPWSTDRKEHRELLEFCHSEGIPVDVPYGELSAPDREKIVRGTDNYYGILGFFEWVETKTYIMPVRVFLSRYRAYTPCRVCGGTRLRPEARLFRLHGATIDELCDWSIERTLDYFQTPWPELAGDPAAALLHSEILSRLQFLCAVGLEYLSLDRQSRTLSGGEVQRVHLTRALGSALVNVLYVLDEPSVGLHARDQRRLMGQLKRLTDLGNTVVMVEHDPGMIRVCDQVVDMGPGGGEKGGDIVFQGSPEELDASPESLTGAYLSGRLTPLRPGARRRPDWQRAVVVEGASENNLKHITATFPLGLLIGISGVSGSGKSTLIEKTLYQNWLRHAGKPTDSPGVLDAFQGAEQLKEIVLVDQQPVGRSPRANLLTYTKVLDPLRKLLAETAEARARGYSARHFSFNVAGGRCERCKGEGFERVEMQFLADVFIRCPQCDGKRFKAEVLEVRVRGLSIGDMLECTAQELLERFSDRPAIARALEPIVAIGLDYLRLGQPLSTLSGGEAQRLKLIRHLGGNNHTANPGGHHIFLLDEPTTGLHPHDLRKLIEVLQRLVDLGHTIVVVEHNLELLAACDWIIDLGPEGGERGGSVVAAGPPEFIAEHPESHTGRHLQRILQAVPEGVKTTEAESGGVKTADVRPESTLTADMGLADAEPEGLETPAVPAEAAEPNSAAPRNIAASSPAILVEPPAIPLEPPARRAGPERTIAIRGAHEHNLRIDRLHIDLGRMTVITGLSGSGKSTLAFDILFAEGQRRYLECLSTYVRQYFKILEKPNVDQMLGVPPTVAIEQRSSRLGKRSTVATITEIYHFLRLLYAKLGRQHCPQCGLPLAAQSFDEILAMVEQETGHAPFRIFSPLVRGRKGIYRDLFQRLAKMGFRTVRVDGDLLPLDPVPVLARSIEHDIELLVLDTAEGAPSREQTADKVRQALSFGGGFFQLEGAELKTFSQHLYCPQCRRGLAPLDPRLFSFNSRHGACSRCGGIGSFPRIRVERLVGPPDLPLKDGLLRFLGESRWLGSAARLLERRWLDTLGVDPEKSFHSHDEDARTGMLYGRRGRFPGLVPMLEQSAGDEQGRRSLEPFLEETPCDECGGERLNAQARAVLVQGWSIGRLVHLDIGRFEREWQALRFEQREAPIAEPISKQILERIAFLREVGLDYLELDRSGDTLSGGETQRIRLAAQLGSNLTGVCYILDEPTIGLHPVDTRRLLGTLSQLKGKGNTVVVVEHDSETMKQADTLLELGPGAGRDGGLVTGQGPYRDLSRKPDTLTGRWFGPRAAPTVAPPRSLRLPPKAEWLKVAGATFRTLDKVSVHFPLERITCVTGVSGSGKSTLVHDVIYLGIEERLGKTYRGMRPVVKSISGHAALARVLEVDHNPIGRTPRSTPATYVGIWNDVRQLFASLPEARKRGFAPKRFSFNVKGGRCEECQGQGRVRVEMHFLPDVHVLCETCRGARFTEETLAVKYKGRSIADVLAMTIEEARELFEAFPRIVKPLHILHDLGLGYITLGQSSPTLSGGEAQRIKLASEVGHRRTRTLYILDEPTTGLHRADVERLVAVLRMLVAEGHTVLAIEHNPEFILACDYLIDMGPGSGAGGGRVVTQGTPRQVLRQTGKSATAWALVRHLEDAENDRQKTKPRKTAKKRGTAAGRKQPKRRG